METSKYDRIEAFATLKKQDQHSVLKELASGALEKCSFEKGYITQEVFGCKTCYPNGDCGFCKACLINCHNEESHDTFEVGTRLRFKCDCGVFKHGLVCSLSSDKMDAAEHNDYSSHNFKNRFCICNEEYEGGVEMIACCYCYDFFHFEHLDIPASLLEEIVQKNDYEFVQGHSFLCDDCLKAKFTFLKESYPDLVFDPFKSECGVEFVPVDPKQGRQLIGQKRAAVTPQIASEQCKLRELEVKMEIAEEARESKREKEETEGMAEGRDEVDKGRDEEAKEGSAEGTRKAKVRLEWCRGAFLVSSWKEEICHCPICKEKYDKLGILDEFWKVNLEEDEEEEHEESKRDEEIETVGVSKLFECLPPEMGTNDFNGGFGQLDHEKQIHIARGVADFKQAWLEFVESFPKDHVVTKEDIKQLFEKINEKRSENNLEQEN